MAKNSPKRNNLITVTGIVLLLLITVKVFAPAFGVKIIGKISALSSQTNNTDSEKKAENSNNLAKEKELTNTCNSIVSHPRFYTNITHLTEYHNNYQSAYYSKVTAPPPDLSFRSIA